MAILSCLVPSNRAITVSFATAFFMVCLVLQLSHYSVLAPSSSQGCTPGADDRAEGISLGGREVLRVLVFYRVSHPMAVRGSHSVT